MVNSGESEGHSHSGEFNGEPIDPAVHGVIVSPTVLKTPVAKRPTEVSSNKRERERKCV